MLELDSQPSIETLGLAPIEEMMAGRGGLVDHATVHRWARPASRGKSLEADAILQFATSYINESLDAVNHFVYLMRNTGSQVFLPSGFAACMEVPLARDGSRRPGARHRLQRY